MSGPPGVGELVLQEPSQRQDRESHPDQVSTTSDRTQTVAKRTRGRTGCLNCRRRRKKCDEKKPTCSKCRLQNEKCELDNGLIFRFSGINSGLPFMRQSSIGNASTPNEYRIVDMTSDTSRRHARKHLYSDQTITERDLRLNSASGLERPWQWPKSHEISSCLSSDAHQRVQNPSLESWIEPLSDQNSDQNDKINNTIPSMVHTLTDSNQIKRSFRYASNVNPVGHSSSGTGDHDSYIGNNTPLNVSSASLSDNAEVTSSKFSEARDRSSSTTMSITESAVFSSSCDPCQPGFDTIELDALDYLMSNSATGNLFSSTMVQDEGRQWSNDQNQVVLIMDQNIAESPDVYAMYYPNPAYKELHAVFHNYMVETAKMTELTREATPEATFDGSQPTKNHLTDDRTSERAIFEGINSLNGLPEAINLTNRRELELWQNYLDEIAVWLDMFDVERHFQLKIPILAKTAGHLRYSILALSARQKERVNPEKPYTESLTLYQKAIELIVLELDSLDTAVIASCILLCVLEMMSSSPKAWSRHLEGCSMLLQAAGINGTVGGVRQALFWCFARMDVWGGFLSDTLTKIPTSGWFVPSQSMSMAVARFKTDSGGFDHYANYAVFLCASVINVLSTRSQPVIGSMENLLEANASYCARWKALFDLLEDWYASRPEAMLPLMATSAMAEDHSHPFPIVLYGNSPAVNGNQLYHASSLLILQEKPKDVWLPKSQKSIQWHARQICGIAVSNNNHGAWINALQPLWVAGKVMSHPIEHREILGILARIEKETGWATSWRAEDLKDYWGDTD